MHDQNFSEQQPEPQRRLDYVSAKARAIAAGAASAATMALIAFVMVVMPPLQSGTASLAMHGALNAGGIV